MLQAQIHASPGSVIFALTAIVRSLGANADALVQKLESDWSACDDVTGPMLETTLSECGVEIFHEPNTSSFLRRVTEKAIDAESYLLFGTLNPSYRDLDGQMMCHAQADVPFVASRWRHCIAYSSGKVFCNGLPGWTSASILRLKMKSTGGQAKRNYMKGDGYMKNIKRVVRLRMAPTLCRTSLERKQAIVWLPVDESEEEVWVNESEEEVTTNQEESRQKKRISEERQPDNKETKQDETTKRQKGDDIVQFTESHAQWKAAMTTIFRTLLLRYIPGGSRVVYLDAASQATTASLCDTNFALFVANNAQSNSRIVSACAEMDNCLATTWKHHKFQAAWFDLCTGSVDPLLDMVKMLLERDFETPDVLIGYTLSARDAAGRSMFARFGCVRRLLLQYGTLQRAEDLFPETQWHHGQMASEFHLVHLSSCSWSSRVALKTKS